MDQSGSMLRPVASDLVVSLQCHWIRAVGHSRAGSSHLELACVADSRTAAVVVVVG